MKDKTHLRGLLDPSQVNGSGKKPDHVKKEKTYTSAKKRRKRVGRTSRRTGGKCNGRRKRLCY